MFRVTRPYLNLLVKTRTFFRINIVLYILKREMPFRMHKIIFCSRKNYKKKSVPNLPKFLDLLPETHFIFYLA